MIFQCPSNEGWGPLSPVHPGYLTTCFQHGVLVPCLNAIFIITAIVYLYGNRRIPSLPSALVSSRLFWTKLLFVVIVLLASTVELAIITYQFPYICAYTLSLSLQTVMIAIAVCLHYSEQNHNRIASTPLLLFWLTSIILSLIRLRTALSVEYVNDFNGLAIPISFFAVAALAVFVLECLPKPRELFKPNNTDKDNSGFGKPEDSISGNSTAESPEERANIFSRFMFMWVGSLLAKGYHSQLQLEDIWKMDGQFRPDVVNAQFQRNWQRELKSAKPSLFWATARAYWKIWALAAMHEFLRLTMKFLRPIVLSWLIGFAASYGTDQGSPIEHGYFYAVMLFFVSSWMNIANRQRWSYAQHIERLVRTSYMTAIYQKSLALSNNTRQKYDIGSIVTHMSVDTEIFTYSIEDVSLDMWSEPLQMGIAMFMLYHLLGWSSLVGVFALLVCTPIVSRYGQAIGARSKLLMEYRDQRMGIMNEILMGIRVVKMYAWESSFLKRINDIRIKSELDIISKNNLLNSLITAATTLVSFIVNFATFGIYSVFDNISHGPLSAQLVFVGMPLLDAVADSFGLIPGIVPDATRGIASFYRIYDFLTASEIDAFAVARDTYDRNLPESSTNDVLVKIVDGYFSWSSVGKPTLGDIAIKCKRDELVAVIGKVGSGKSSLVSAILGDMIKCSGNVMVRGSIAYVPQQPWILNATLRDNILFGSAYDEEFYNRVIDACALIQDIDTFLAGDMTEIGERGINLSGGQKMRVSLARAVYARADIYILDDPLAAVDVHVSKHLFAYVLGPQGMLQSRARILTTNALQYLHSVDSIVMLHDGKIIEQGTFEQVMDSQSDIYEFVYQLVDDNQSSEESSYLAQDNNVNKNCANGSSTTSVLADQIKKHTNTDSTQKVATQQEFDKPINDNGTLIEPEHRNKGKVNWDIYYSYFKAGGLENVSMAAFAYIIAISGEVCTMLWLRHWTSSSSSIGNGIKASLSNPMWYYLTVYCALGLLATVAILVQMIFMQSRFSTRASTIIHQNMLTGVLRSPMSFFDTTPTGRILNRFSSDVARCDVALPSNISLLSGCMGNVFLAIVLIGISIPQVLLITPFLAIVGHYIQGLFVRSARDIRRLESTACSSVYAFFQESISGVSIIRAYGQQSRFISEIEDRLGKHVRINNATLLVNQWLAMHMELIGSMMILGVSILSVATIQKSGIGNADTIGLVVGAVLTLGFKMNWVVRSYSMLELSMTHLERILEYTNLPSEAANVVEDLRPKDMWPEQGVVEFKNYSMRYRDGLDLVLKNLSFHVLPRQKVGIVGRTGAGKSSLTLALFRIVEAASGQILLDGEDIAKYGLFDVRSKLSIIPQDPVLFAGTVRENLDPFNSYSDQNIWRALEQAHLAEYIRSNDERLEFMVTQSGKNFSVGQRQLICLARALLKHAKVLVLDEATAAVDNVTDEIIQRTIRNEFKDCTVLTIAHRLNTVIDSDMVLVVDNGQLAEYDTPQNLLANKGTLFSRLVEESQSVK